MDEDNYRCSQPAEDGKHCSFAYAEGISVGEPDAVQIVDRLLEALMLKAA
jgi:hypothetical protein